MGKLRADHAGADAQRREVRLIAEALDQLGCAGQDGFGV
jgi:hypothetical protein